MAPHNDRLSGGLLTRMRGMGRGLLDLVYPPRCPGCSAVGELFCEKCRSAVRTYPIATCPRCGRAEPSRGLCAACAAEPARIDGIFPATIYTHPMREAIQSYKYENVRDLAGPLAEWLVVAWHAHAITADVIVPVPLHARREAERGYNQAALLARELSRRVGVPTASRELIRTVRTRPQVGLTRAERQMNIAGAFRCTEEVPGLRIVLVDDVCTTGATLESCAAALKDSGAASVVGLTVARPGWSDLSGSETALTWA